MNKLKKLMVIFFCSLIFAQSTPAEDFSWEMFLPAITGLGAKRDVCDQSHLYLCKDNISCINAKGYWYNNTCNVLSPPYPGSLQFNMSKLVGLVKMNILTPKNSTDKIDLTPKSIDETESVMGIDNTGNLIDITSEDLPIREFLISPTGEVYIILNYLYSYIDRNGNQQQAILLKVNPNDNTYTNIDNTLSSINQQVGSNKSIQFDALGNIYYFGSSNSNIVLRKSKGGAHTDLINSNIYVWDWLVLDNGTVFIYRESPSTLTRWFRKINPDNSLINIIGSGASINFIKKFPDNKIYFGDWGKLFGVGRIKQIDNFLSEKCLIGGASGGLCGTGELLGNEYEDLATCADNGLDPYIYYCGISSFSGAFVNDIQSTSNSVFAVVGHNTRQIWRYYPKVEYIDFAMVKDVPLFKTSESFLIIHGLNAFGQNKLVKYDLASSVETDLLPSDDIEIYHINLKSDGKIWFDGLRFSNNTYVIGYVNTSNLNQVVFVQDTNYKLEDFQTF